jgi:hypothetical protein
MKKLGFLIVLFTAISFYVFGDNGEQEEIDHLLFLPNSGNQFADETRARAQLDNAARYLKSKTLTEAQIHVYGYTADVANDIDSAGLSRERALHVMSELQRRGISSNYFAAPVGHGSVNLWGSNVTEEDRSLNRRVRILFEDVIITPEVAGEAQPEIAAFEPVEADAIAVEETAAAKETGSFNWWWLLLLLLPLLILFWIKRKNKKTKPSAHARQPDAAPKVETSSPSRPELPASPSERRDLLPAELPAEGGEPKYYRLTEEEIRNLSYKLFEERNHQHGSDETDWYNAIGQLFVKYEAQGYIVLWP